MYRKRIPNIWSYKIYCTQYNNKDISILNYFSKPMFNANRSISNLKSSVIIITLLIFSIFKTYSQSSVASGKDKVPSSPTFKGGIPGMMNYFRNEIFPIISDETKDVENFPTSLKMTLTIDKKGKVIDIQFINTRMEEDCRNAVAGKLLEMKGWKAAQLNGKAVIGKYNCYIGCLLLQ